MSDQPDSGSPQYTAPMQLETDLEPTQKTVLKPSWQQEIDQIPVDQLLRATRELTERLTNEDRQRLAVELKTTGHQPTIQSKAPVTIQQFFAGEIDLDSELAKRFTNAPLLSEISLRPALDEPILVNNATAVLITQDASAMLTIDVRLLTGAIEATFTFGSMLSLRFDPGWLEIHERQHWIELMRRENGISFLWSAERWEKDYLIFVVRDHFARVYAFSPHRFEASARVTPDVMNQLLNWLEVLWVRETPVVKKGESEARRLPPPPTEEIPPERTAGLEW